MKRLLTLAAILLCTLLAAGSSFALVRFDFEQKYFTDPGYIVKDHCLLRLGEVYHLFYLRGDPTHSVGHATSTDLVHWKLETPVLSSPETGWNELGLWAPCITKVGGTYLMYFTGVNDQWAQQTGLAMSEDLFNWVTYPNPVYHPDPSWAEWDVTTWSHGRDPFIFKHDGWYYQFLTAKTFTNRGAIACARSTDMLSWEDIGPFYIHDTWHVLESVQLIERNNRYNMFFTEEVVNGTSFMASDSLFSGWDISTRTILDPGHAPEVNLFDDNYIFSRHTIYNDNQGFTEYTIVIDTLKWSGDLPYVYKAWPLGGDWNLVYGNAFIYQPTYGNNPYARGDSVDVNYRDKCWIGTYERFQGPLKYGTAGGYQGDYAKGIIRSNTFTITGNSMSLLVGGGNYPDACYVALVRASTGQILFTETGRNTDAMDERKWNIKPYKGQQVYIEISDQSTAAFGHINCDEIVESMTLLDNDSDGDGRSGKKDLNGLVSTFDDTPGQPRLDQNTPNPFNPMTTISYYLPADAFVTLDIYNVNGARVRRLVNGHIEQGSHDAVWNGRDSTGTSLSSGIYFCRLVIEGQTVATRKMVLLK